jgi:hypothetical protein
MQKQAPAYTLDFVLHPEQDATYRHFENASANPFQANPRDFPRVNAWWLGESALLTYWNPADAIPIFEAAGFQCEFITADGTDCYVVAQADFVVVAFRGTQPDEWSDILADANIMLVPWQTGMVHLGFKKAFDVIRPQLDTILARLAQGRTLWFCGHSLGAALATLAADDYPGTRGVCTLGSPRVGDSTFAHAFDTKLLGKTFRYVNDHDVVTHVPPPIGYQHVDLRRFIAPDGAISTGEPAISHFFADLIGKPRTLLEVIEGLSKGALKSAPTFLLDHMPKAYAVWMWNDYDANG